MGEYTFDCRHKLRRYECPVCDGKLKDNEGGGVALKYCTTADAVLWDCPYCDDFFHSSKQSHVNCPKCGEMVWFII